MILCLLTKNIGHFQRVRDLKVIGLNEIYLVGWVEERDPTIVEINR